MAAVHQWATETADDAAEIEQDRGKDRLKALAAAAARAAGANLTTYFADDDCRSPRGRRFDYKKTS